MADTIRDRFATPPFRETRGGLFICGINWGGTNDDAVAAGVRARRSFFSDADVPSYRYRRRIESWFRLWGFPLATDAADAGAFEKCISQTNWLGDRSPRSEHRAQPKYLAAHVDQFLAVLRARRPKVVLLFGSCLGLAVERCLGELEAELGPLRRASKRSFHAKFPFSFREFDFPSAALLAFPHPTGAVGTTDAQARECRPYVRRAFARLKALEGKSKGG